MGITPAEPPRRSTKYVGQFYHDFIYHYTGSYGAGSASQRFLAALGNHDWQTTGARPYLDFFTLPGNERYYSFTRGPVAFFDIDSDGHEPDGNTSTSGASIVATS